jgi:hypothetical protein
MRSYFEGRLAVEVGRERQQDQAPKSPQPGEDASEVVACRGEDGVGGVADAVLEMTASEVSVALHVADHSFDCVLRP